MLLVGIPLEYAKIPATGITVECQWYSSGMLLVFQWNTGGNPVGIFQRNFIWNIPLVFQWNSSGITVDYWR